MDLDNFSILPNNSGVIEWTCKSFVYKSDEPIDISDAIDICKILHNGYITSTKLREDWKDTVFCGMCNTYKDLDDSEAD